MKKSAQQHAVLVIDVGGTHVKCLASAHTQARQFDSGAGLTPKKLVAGVQQLVGDWHFDCIAMGYPGVVRDGKILREPHNLGKGWRNFDFEAAFGCPVKLCNDAAMQALGAYRGGRMLFLGLGTGLGSALIVDGKIEAMELAHLRFAHGRTYEEFVGESALKRMGRKKWRQKVQQMLEGFRSAFLPDYIALGGGNARLLKKLPAKTHVGTNTDAFRGGFRLWSQ